jgi:hypothetical protein
MDSKYRLSLKFEPMQKDNISPQEVAKNVDDSITQLDELRVSGLNSLNQFQQTWLDLLKLERVRLSQKNANDPRIPKMDERLSYGDQLMSALNLEIRKSSVKTTPLPTGAWRMQGNVYYPDNTPASGVTVFFSDSNKTWIRELGSACTDATGYYTITLTENQITGITTKKQLLYLSASDSKQKLLCRDTEDSVISKGLIDYKNIYLNGTQCTPPAAPDKPVTPDKPDAPSKPVTPVEKDEKGSSTPSSNIP